MINANPPSVGEHDDASKVASRQLEVMAETARQIGPLRDALRAVVALGEAANRRALTAVKLRCSTPLIEQIDGAIREHQAQHLKRNLDRSAGLVSCIATRMTLRENVAQRAYATSARAKLWTCFSVLTASQIKAHLEEQVAVWGGRGKRCGRATNQGERRRYRTHFHGWANERAKSTRHSRGRVPGAV